MVAGRTAAATTTVKGSSTMRIRKIVAGGVAALAMAGSLAFAAPAGASSPTAPTLKQILDAQGGGFDRNWYDFDIIDAVVDKILAENPQTPAGPRRRRRTAR